VPNSQHTKEVKTWEDGAGARVERREKRDKAGEEEERHGNRPAYFATYYTRTRYAS
jgi:hypothetical protein